MRGGKHVKVKKWRRQDILRFRADARKLILGSIGTPLDHSSVNLKCMSNSFLVVRSKKFNYMKFILRFFLEIEVKTEGHCPFVQGQIFKLVQFNKNGLKLIGLSCRFRKCIVSYTFHVPIFGQRRGQSSTISDHRAYYNRHIWALTFDPVINILPESLDMQNYTFSGLAR